MSKSECLRGDETGAMKRVQLAWLKFHDSNCQDIFDEISAGREESIDTLHFMTPLIRDNADEIERLSAVNGHRREFRFVSPLERAGYDRAELMEKLRSTNVQERIVDRGSAQ